MRGFAPKSSIKASLVRGFLLLILMFAGKLFAALPPGIQKVELLLAKFELTKADKEAGLLPEPFASFYKSRISFYHAFATEDPIWINKAQDDQEKARDKALQLPNSDPYRGCLESEIAFARGVLNYFDNNFITAARDLRSSYVHAQEVNKDHPDFIPILKINGAMQAWLAAVPDKYKWMLNVLGFDYSLSKGLDKLKKASQKSELLRYEAEIIYAYALRKLANQESNGLEIIRKLTLEVPDSPVFLYLYANFALADQKNSITDAVLKDISAYKKNANIVYIPFIDYIQAKAAFFKMDLNSSIQLFKEFTTTYKGDGYKGDALFKTAVAYALLNKDEEAKMLFQKLSSRKENHVDMDNYARGMALIYSKRNLNLTEKRLYTARNYFDGGYFELAIKTLDPVMQNLTKCSAGEQLEANYRLGRIYHKSENYTKAKMYYKIAMLKQDKEALWMKVYAEYYLGTILEKEKNFPEALKHYKSVLDYHGYYYQSDLEQQAKSAVSRLNK